MEITYVKKSFRRENILKLTLPIFLHIDNGEKFIF